MAFTVFANGTTASADDVNNNFYHTWQGHRIPMGGASMAATTGAYDIGTTTAKWYNVYANNLICDTITISNTWKLLSTVNLTAVASSIDFTGLNSDTQKEYMIDLYAVMGYSGATSSVYLQINTTTCLSTTIQLQRKFYTTTRAASITNIYPHAISITPQGTTTAIYNYSRIYINKLTGFVDCLINESNSFVGNYINSFYETAGIFGTTATITSISFVCSTSTARMCTGTYCNIWYKIA